MEKIKSRSISCIGDRRQVDMYVHAMDGTPAIITITSSGIGVIRIRHADACILFHVVIILNLWFDEILSG